MNGTICVLTSVLSIRAGIINNVALTILNGRIVLILYSIAFSLIEQSLDNGLNGYMRSQKSLSKATDNMFYKKVILWKQG